MTDAMSEREKMVAGLLYDAMDPELVAARAAVREVLDAINRGPRLSPDALRDTLAGLLAAGGETVGVEPPFFVDYGFNVSLGANCYFNTNCVLLDVCPITLGEHVKCGPNVQLYTAGHPLNAALRRREESGQPIAIGDDVWIGGGSIVLPGVTIGDRAVVGAGSVVTRDIPPDVVAVGNPCRVIRTIEQT